MRHLLWLVFLLFPTLLHAQSCFDLWVERNAIFDRSGYCFSSVLGKTYFDNRDCHTTDAALSRTERDRVAAIQALEKRRGCRIDTSQPYRRTPESNEDQCVDLLNRVPGLEAGYADKFNALIAPEIVGKPGAKPDFLVNLRNGYARYHFGNRPGCFSDKRLLDELDALDNLSMTLVRTASKARDACKGEHAGVAASNLAAVQKHRDRYKDFHDEVRPFVILFLSDC